MERHGRLKLLVLVCAALSAIGPRRPSAQGNVGSPAESHYKGRVITDPEAMSGLWEASNGHGGFVGIHLVLGTTVVPDAKSDRRTLNGVEQRWEYLNLGVYEQKGAEFAFGEEGYFSDRPGAAAVTIENGRLELHFVPRVAGTQAVDLDLVKQEGDRWVGRFHRGAFDERVILERPGAREKADNAVVGVWRLEGFLGRVVHVGEQTPRQFIGWSDMLQIPGAVGFGPSVRPYLLFEVYGERVKVQRSGESGVLFEMGAYSGICCAQIWAGRLSADGHEIKGTWGRDVVKWSKTGK